MPGKNYYVILGIDEDETASGIRGAFRNLVKRYHPDRVGPQGTKHLQEIIEAYEHLSDPERRRRYNDELQARARPVPIRTPEPEPLVPKSASSFARADIARPSGAPLFDRVLRNFPGTGVPRGARPEALNVELVLSPDEAAYGVEAPIRLPFFQRCPHCNGSGHDWVFPCSLCRQTGLIEAEKRFHVQIPPNVRDGSIAELSLRNLGLHNLFLRVHIRVREKRC